MGLQSEVIRVTTTGSAGSAAGATTGLHMVGELLYLYVDFHASAPATTDITITAAGSGATVWTRSNSVADATVAPAATCVTTANVAITDSHRPLFIADHLTVTLAQCDALTNAVVVTAVWRS
jgi:hypothetical protein